jgi:predicted molibdopterin-dependent oxidoreductase YjgC
MPRCIKFMSETFPKFQGVKCGTCTWLCPTQKTFELEVCLTTALYLLYIKAPDLTGIGLINF